MHTLRACRPLSRGFSFYCELNDIFMVPLTSICKSTFWTPNTKDMCVFIQQLGKSFKRVCMFVSINSLLALLCWFVRIADSTKHDWIYLFNSCINNKAMNITQNLLNYILILTILQLIGITVWLYKLKWDKRTQNRFE